MTVFSSLVFLLYPRRYICQQQSSSENVLQHHRTTASDFRELTSEPRVQLKLCRRIQLFEGNCGRVMLCLYMNLPYFYPFFLLRRVRVNAPTGDKLIYLNTSINIFCDCLFLMQFSKITL